MEPVASQHALRPLWLGLGAVIAIVVALAVAHKSSSSGVASTRVVLDTPTSQVIDAAPFGAYSLPWRASLLVHLMAGEPVKRELAAELGISPDALTVDDRALNSPAVAASLPLAGAEAAAADQTRYVLRLNVNGQSLPIISIKARAPDPAAATKLATSAVTVLKERAPAPGEFTEVSQNQGEVEAAQIIPSELEGFVVEDLAPLRAKELDAGQSPIKVLGLSALVFAVWCIGLAFGPRLVRLARALGDASDRPDGPSAARLDERRKARERFERLGRDGFVLDSDLKSLLERENEFQHRHRVELRKRAQQRR